MGYIKKLKNNELVGGTDKTTIYPVTSTEAVFEEVSDNEFKSQKYLNNNITNERIVDNTIENRKLKDDTIDMGKLNTQLKTTIQNAYDASWKVKKEPFSLETKYNANDVVYDPDTNSSYVSLTADNQGNPVNPEDEGYVEGKWRIIMNGISAVQATEEIEETKNELIDYIQDNLKDQVDDEIADAESRVAAAEQYAQGVIAEAEQTARSISGIVYQTVAATPNYTDTIPVQNKAVTAQIGYYTCTGGSGATIIVDDTDAAAFTPVKGGQIKILMTQKSAITSGNVQLQFGSVTATKKVLLYNKETVSASNSWDAGEVLSVYYDGTYYQASNAIGGGSAVGKKVINPTATNRAITTNGDTIGAVITNNAENWCYAKYAVNEGDVVMISGTGGNSPRLWAIADASENILSKEETINVTRENLVLVMPEEAAWIVLNNNYSAYPNYKWYYAKAGSVGVHEMLTEAYLYGDLRTISVGRTYEKGEAVKTADKQLLRVTKAIIPMTVTDTVAVGDLKVYDNGTVADTYIAQKAVELYNGIDTEGLYAIGRPSIVTITVDSSSLSIEEDTDITVTIGGDTQTITVPAAASETKDADIASLIATAFTSIDGWVLTDNEDGTLTLKCNTGGANTIVVSSEVGETGLLITSTAVNGTNTLSQYNEGVWENVYLADYVADSTELDVDDITKMWKKLDVQSIIDNYTEQDSINSRLKKLEELETYDYTETLIFNGAVGSFPANNTNHVLENPMGFTVGNKYRIEVNLDKTISADVAVYLRKTPTNATNIQLRDLTIKAGTISSSCIYEPSEDTNFQYFNRWGNVGTSIWIRYKVYLLTPKTVKEEISELEGKVENISCEDIKYNAVLYSNANNDFSWKTGNPSNPSAPTYANKYFTLNTGIEISKVKIYKSSSNYNFRIYAKVGNSYIDISGYGKSFDKIIDVTGKGYKVLCGLLWDKPSDADALAEDITIEVTFNLKNKLDSIDESVAHAGGTYFTNPIIRVDNPDPAVWWGEDGYWYILATGNLSTKTMWRSANLVDWENTGETPFTQTAIETWAALGNGTFWAPEIVKVGDRWNMYLSATQNPMYVFTSKFPTYGFEYAGVIADHLLTHENIDACVRHDRDGTLWMFFDSCRQGMYRVKLNEDGTQVISNTLEHVAGLPDNVDGNTNRAKTYEGAYLYRRKGYWYLIVSAGNYNGSSYCLRVGRSATLDGTFVDKNGNLMTEGNASLLLSSSGAFYGTGHNGSIITDKQNRTWMLFHSHWTGMSSSSSRPVCISEVLWDEDGWPYFVNNTLTASGIGPRM